MYTIGWSWIPHRGLAGIRLPGIWRRSPLASFGHLMETSLSRTER